MRAQRKIPVSGEKILADISELRGWNTRQGQLDMVNHIDHVVGEQGAHTATIYAPTGTGKSLGLLCGIVPHQKRAIITTSTKALQNQLRETELPKFTQDIKTLYGEDLVWSVIKGQNNYPCYHALEKLVKKYPLEKGLFEDESDVKMKQTLHAMWEKINHNVEAGLFGSLDCEDELSSLPLDIQTELKTDACDKGYDAFSSAVTNGSSVEDILHETFYHNCTYTYAYAYALTADIVVMNTHLLVLEAEKFTSTIGVPFHQGVGKVDEMDEISKSQLKGTPIVAFDEAHHVPNILSSCLSKTVCLQDVADDIAKNVSILKKMEPGLNVDNFVDILKQCAVDIKDVDETKEVTDEERDTLYSIMSDVSGCLEYVIRDVNRADSQSTEVTNFTTMKTPLVAKWMEWLTISKGISQACVQMWNDGYSFDITVGTTVKGELTVNSVPMVTTMFGRKCAAIMNTPNTLLMDTLVSTEGKDFSEMYQGDVTFIACSGTLPPSLSTMVGFPYPEHLAVESPFDHSKGRIYVPDEDTVSSPPKNFRDTAAHALRDRQVAEQLGRLIDSSGGRTLVLTTSNKKVDELYEYVSQKFPHLTVLRQGVGSRQENMKIFSEDETSVFVGTQSFWEGVDVPGRALTSVFIDKIMFPNLSDPVFEARSKFVKQQEGNPFKEVMCTHASVMIAQAVGRLIRSIDDCGLVTIADPRVMDLWYSGIVMSLVEAQTPVTRQEKAALVWLKTCVDGSPVEKGEWNSLRSKKGKPKRRKKVAVNWKK